MGMADPDPFGARDTLPSGEAFLRLDRLVDPLTLPYTICVLLENLLRRAGSEHVREDDVRALAAWPAPHPGAQLAFMPARVLMQDLTGVPAVVDLAALRAAVDRRGADPGRVDPLVPVDLVIDHSVQVDAFGSDGAYARNIEREYERNGERYQLLRWAQRAFRNFRVVPPGMGICHQVNLEYLGRVVQVRDGVALPDTLVGTDSHTTMINAIGVLGWGVGGIEAEAVMLGQPLYMTPPQVVGVRIGGELRTGVTATDLVLTLTEQLRKHGVVGKFIEFFGPGLAVADGRRPGHALQHVARVRGDGRHLPGRRPDPALPHRHRPAGRSDRARGALHEGAGPLPHRLRAAAGLLRDARPRPRRRRAQPGRAAPAAGPGVAAPGGALVLGRVRDQHAERHRSSATDRS